MKREKARALVASILKTNAELVGTDARDSEILRNAEYDLLAVIDTIYEEGAYERGDDEEAMSAHADQAIRLTREGGERDATEES